VTLQTRWWDGSLAWEAAAVSLCSRKNLCSSSGVANDESDSDGCHRSSSSSRSRCSFIPLVAQLGGVLFLRQSLSPRSICAATIPLRTFLLKLRSSTTSRSMTITGLLRFTPPV
jgi:hypothetical protein